MRVCVVTCVCVYVYYILQGVDVDVRDAQNSVGLLMLNGALVVLSSLLFDDPDQFALGLLNHGRRNVVVLLAHVGAALDRVVFAAQFAHPIQLEHVAHLDIV